MQAVPNRIVRWMGVVAMCVVLAACGGGGGGGGSDAGLAVATPPVGDARNGTYTMFAADAGTYTLNLDLDAKTYRVTGANVDAAGTLQQDRGTFLFVPGNGTGPIPFNTLRFQMATDAVIGEFALPSGAMPFIAARQFVTTITDASGVYDMLGRWVNTAGGGPSSTFAQQGELTADGRLRICADAVVHELATCPASSVVTGTVTVAGDVFTAVTPVADMVFRVAQIGPDKVFLRAAPWKGNRQFIVGVPAITAFADGTFVGSSTLPAWDRIVVTNGQVTTASTSPDDGKTSSTGTLDPLPFNPGIRVFVFDGGGFFHVVRAQEFAVFAASPADTSGSGFMDILRKQ